MAFGPVLGCLIGMTGGKCRPLAIFHASLVRSPNDAILVGHIREAATSVAAWSVHITKQGTPKIYH